MTRHTIQQGEYLSLLAEKAGFRNAMTVWEAAENADLRAARPNPCVLYPGDILTIPDKTVRAVGAPTTKINTYVVKTDQLQLRFKLLDFDNKPMAGVPITLTVEGDTSELTTAGDGSIFRKIPRTAQSAQIAIPSLAMDLPVFIGHLDPTAEDSGWRARLVNLGYYAGQVDDSGDDADKLWSWALEEFQCDFGLPITGQPNSATTAKLESVHGS